MYPFSQLVQVAVGEGQSQASLALMVQGAALPLHRDQRVGVAVAAKDAADEGLRLRHVAQRTEAACVQRTNG